MTSNHKPATAAPTAPAVTVLTATQMVTVDELRHVKRHVRTLEARKDELTAEVKGWIRESGGGVDSDGVLVATISERAGRRNVDLARLAKDFPAAYAACVSAGSAQEVLTLPTVSK